MSYLTILRILDILKHLVMWDNESFNDIKTIKS